MTCTWRTCTPKCDGPRRDYDPQIVALTSKTLGWPAVIEIAQMVRETCPNALIVVGGPHMTIYAEESLTWDCFDIAVVGDGEETILEICEHVEQGGGGWDEIQGIVYRDDAGELQRTEGRPLTKNIDKYPMTAWDLMPVTDYHCLTLLKPFATMVTTRGCPWHCGYCSQVYSEKLRFRSVEHVVDEMEFLERMTYSPATLKKPIKPLKINGLTPPPTPPTPPSRGSSRGSATSLVGRWRPPTSDLLEPVDEDVEATGGADGGLAGGAARSSNPVLLRRSVSGTAADQFARSEVGSQYSGQSSRLSGSGHARPTTALSAVSGMSSLQRLELSRDPTERHQQLQERQRQLQEMEEETALRLKEMEVELSRFVRRADGGLLLQTRRRATSSSWR